MRANHRAEHGKVTPGHISMVIETDGLLPGRLREGGSVSLCPHQRGWHGETTDADCACSMAKSIDRLPYTYGTRARHGCKECCTTERQFQGVLPGSQCKRLPATFAWSSNPTRFFAMQKVLSG